MKELVPTAEDIASFFEFDRLTRNEIQLISPIMKKFEFEKGEYPVAMGQVCDHIFQVITGTIRQYYIKEEKEVTEYFALDGSGFFCVESFIKRTPSIIAAVALEKTVLMGLPYDPFLALQQENYNIERVYQIYLENSLIISQYRMTSILFETAYERYQQLLLRYPEIVQKVPSIYIASFLGVSPETLSRMKHSRI